LPRRASEASDSVDRTGRLVAKSVAGQCWPQHHLARFRPCRCIPERQSTSATESPGGRGTCDCPLVGNERKHGKLNTLPHSCECTRRVSADEHVVGSAFRSARTKAVRERLRPGNIDTLQKCALQGCSAIAHTRSLRGTVGALDRHRAERSRSSEMHGHSAGAVDSGTITSQSAVHMPGKHGEDGTSAPPGGGPRTKASRSMNSPSPPKNDGTATAGADSCPATREPIACGRDGASRPSS
jgi:hypothetical protein